MHLLFSASWHFPLMGTGNRGWVTRFVPLSSCSSRLTRFPLANPCLSCFPLSEVESTAICTYYDQVLGNTEFLLLSSVQWVIIFSCLQGHAFHMLVWQLDSSESPREMYSHHFIFFENHAAKRLETDSAGSLATWVQIPAGRSIGQVP